jgi:hypothetical protein
MPDEQTASPLVQVSLGECERLVNPQTGSPKHHDQTPHSPAVTIVSGLAHNHDDLVDHGRIRRIPAAFVRWDPPGVMAGHRRRGSGTAGGVQQLMSRHGSLLLESGQDYCLLSPHGPATQLHRS